MGLLVTPTLYRKPLSKAISNKRNRDEAEDDVSDDDDVSGNPQSAASDAAPADGHPRPNNSDTDNVTAMDDDEVEDEEDDEVVRKRAEADEFREEKLIAFLNDPEKSTMVFLSSYMREQGLIWWVDI